MNEKFSLLTYFLVVAMRVNSFPPALERAFDVWAQLLLSPARCRRIL